MRTSRDGPSVNAARPSRMRPGSRSGRSSRRSGR
jgi:hypothetical protein